MTRGEEDKIFRQLRSHTPKFRYPAKATQTEKQQGPEKIGRQLGPVDCQRPPDGAAGFPRLQDEKGGGPHEKKEDRPHQGENPRRWREGRLFQGLERLHSVPGEKGGEAAHGQGDGETDQEFLPFFFHKQSPVYRIRGAQVFYSSAVCRPPIWKWVHRYR